MNIDYKILWFEDVKSSFNAKQKLVKRVVEDLGFVFPEPRNEVNNENLDQIDFQIYDLIIADLNLANNEKGSDILNTIREKGIYTEVVFYSSQGEDYVRNELKKFQIDGVYCADRENEDFIEKVKNVIHTTVKKVQDLNNIRGLIMAETSDIDKTMFEIIQTILSKNAFGLKDIISKEIFTNIESKVNKKKENFDTYLKNNNINRVMKDPVMFDAFEKLIIIQFIFNSVDHLIATQYKNDAFRTSYSEITKKRNLLGHETQNLDSGKITIGSGESAFEFNDEFCIEMRKKVRKHRDDLDEFLKSVKTM
jgi:DNA-binding NarL/FixJ family response regulator